MSDTDLSDAGRLQSLPDSGVRVAFGEGKAVREAADDKAAMEAISPVAMHRLGMHFTNGGKKYGDMRNWEKGMPWSRCIGAILRHTFAYLRYDKSEDHLAAIAWNACALMHYEAYKQYQDDNDLPKGWGQETHDGTD